MTVALIILGALVAVGAVLYLLDRRQATAVEPQAEARQVTAEAESQECCGMHLTCEKDTLVVFDTEPVYYDDEELDAFRGRGAGDYSEAEADAFRDVMQTMLPSDIAGWARSLQLRGIELPVGVREELLMIVAEAREKM